MTDVQVLTCNSEFVENSKTRNGEGEGKLSGFPCPSRPSRNAPFAHKLHLTALASRSSKSVFIGLWTVLAKSSNRSLSVFIGLLTLYIGLYRSFSDPNPTLPNEGPIGRGGYYIPPSVPSVGLLAGLSGGRAGAGAGVNTHYIYARLYALPYPPAPPCPVVP